MTETTVLPPVQDSYDRKRRLSNYFNPPELYNNESPDTVTEEDDMEQSFQPNDEQMETNEQDDSIIEGPRTLRRSGRKKIRTSEPEPVRVTTRPVKLTAKSSENEIKKYYLDKKVKKTNLSLETIYEEPQFVNNEEVVMTHRKFRRSINFDTVGVKNPSKIRKRKVRAKKLKTRKKEKKVTLQFLMDKLKEIDEDC